MEVNPGYLEPENKEEKKMMIRKFNTFCSGQTLVRYRGRLFILFIS